MPRVGRTKKGGDPVDKYVGEQIRRYRMMAGLSQTALAETLGVTFQQVQKYEKGTNRIAPSRLVKIAQLLNVEISNFYPPRDTVIGALAEDPIHKLSQTRGGMRLARAYIRFNDEPITTAFVDLAEAIAGKKDSENGATEETNDAGTQQAVRHRPRPSKSGARAAAARPRL